VSRPSCARAASAGAGFAMMLALFGCSLVNSLALEGIRQEAGDVDGSAAKADALSQTCDENDFPACVDLAFMYENGEGVAKSPAIAASLFNIACIGGYALGCFELGLAYDEGVGVSRDAALAVKLYKMACDGGIADGCYNLASNFDHGRGVPKDPTTAVECYAKACDGGVAQGCFNLGVARYHGDGVRKDLVGAAAALAKACDGGYARGCYDLGLCFDRGHGVPKDAATAAECYAKACGGGEADGCVKMASFLVDHAITKDGLDPKQSLALARESCAAANKLQPGAGAYNLARVAALEGQEGECRKWLEDSQKHGRLPSADDIATDACFVAVRDTAWFKAFLKKAKAAERDAALPAKP